MQHAAEHRLAAAHFAGDLDHSLAGGDRVDQRLERGSAVGAGEEELGVRRDAERRLAQTEVFEVHRHGGGGRGVSCEFREWPRLGRIGGGQFSTGSTRRLEPAVEGAARNPEDLGRLRHVALAISIAASR